MGHSLAVPSGYITTAEAAAKYGLTARYIRRLCKDGTIKGAQQFSGVWLVPAGFKWTRQKPGPKTKQAKRDAK